MRIEWVSLTTKGIYVTFSHKPLDVWENVPPGAAITGRKKCGLLFPGKFTSQQVIDVLVRFPVKNPKKFEVDFFYEIPVTTNGTYRQTMYKNGCNQPIPPCKPQNLQDSLRTSVGFAETYFKS